MPYVNIPESRLTGAIAKQVGSIQDVATQKVYGLVNDTVQKVRREACPNLQAVERLQQRINSVQSSISSIQRKVDKFQKLANAIEPIISTIETILILIKVLPIPQSVPPGFGLPVGFSMVQSDLLHMAKEKIKQGKDDIAGIVALIQTPIANIQMYNNILSRINVVTQGCKVEGVLRREVAQGRLTNTRLKQLGIINDKNEYIFSRQGANLFENFDFTRRANVYENNKAIRPVFDQNGKDITPKQLTGREKLQNANNDLLNSLTKLNSGLSNTDGVISEDAKNSIKSFLDTFKTPTKEDKVFNNKFNYLAPNGENYTLVIKIDQNSPEIAPRRFAVAVDKSGVEIIKGPKSFSSSVDVLLNELKFRIDNQLP